MQAAIAACCLFAVQPAQAQQDDTFNRINRLEREIDTLNRAVYKGQVPASAPTILSGSSSGDPGYQANLEVRLAEMEKQLRDLTGKIEQQTFETQQLRERLDRSLGDMELRVGEIEKRNGLASPDMGMTAPSGNPVSGGSLTGVGTLGPDDMAGGNPPMPGSEPMLQPSAGNAAAPITDPNAPAPANVPTQRQLGTLNQAPGGGSIPPSGSDPASLYENAFSQLKSGNYGAAQRDFNGFLTAHPDHPLASNATYWLGETYYAQQKYDQASRIFAESYKKYPKGPKAADSLLKLGMSLGGAGKSKEACVSFKQLKKEFASSANTAVRRADQEMSRLGCVA
jgi:tol-pal system protein YbgF